VWAGLGGLFDVVPVEDILRFERELLDFLRLETSVLSTIAETNLFKDDVQAETEEAIERFKRIFRISDGTMLIKDDPSVDPLARGIDIDQEQLMVRSSR
ncbi:MAG: F0F1 ATP synthase subunit alpha, partial [Propionibacteriaceae bacterium]|nr:F0F1 ATP synthase subunit alpha [Propionibacteriaceae bacterium]